MTEWSVEQAREALSKHLKNRGYGEGTRLAKLCGVGAELPGRWAKGDRTPEADGASREVLETEVGIPAHAWRRPRSKGAAEDSQERGAT